MNKKRVLVVGSNSSIGKEISSLFEQRNYEVIRTSRSYSGSESKTQICIDFENPVTIEECTRNISELDAIVLCAGILGGESLEHYDYPKIIKAFHINTIGPIILLRQLLGTLKFQGVVLVIGSVAAANGSYDEVYASTKSALYGLVKSLARKSYKEISFIGVSPGLVRDSRMFKQFSDSEVQSHIEATPLRDLIDLNSLAKICFDLCQPYWRHLNGHIIEVNGGRYV
jgi:NAD(P)-dependent dehydrogenase (short-subunit alcohol dehydrogenase family)